MIDASRSPRPVWKRLLTTSLLIAAIVAFAWIIWVKELQHHDIQVHSFKPSIAPIVQAVVRT